MSLSLRYGFDGMTDPDAAAYVAAVEAADGQLLEYATGQAINDFVVGCKNDRIWTAIKASCILAGARTLAGALVPLVGTAPTRQGTEGGWSYNRKTGLQGNGTNNYLNSNRASDADPQNNRHAGIYVSTGDSLTTTYYIGGGGNGYIGIGRVSSGNILAGYVSAAAGAIQIANQGNTTGFKGISRASSSTALVRTGGATTSGSQVSSAENITANVAVFADNYNNSVTNYSNARQAFYSIGESLDLALLDTRVTTLITAIAAAIP